MSCTLAHVSACMPAGWVPLRAKLLLRVLACGALPGACNGWPCGARATSRACGELARFDGSGL